MNAWMVLCALACLANQGNAGSIGGGFGKQDWMNKLKGQNTRRNPTARQWGFEFYNWGSTKVKRCPPNVVFVVDGSDSVSLNGFQKAKEYLIREIRAVTSSFAGADVAVLFFSDGIYREMPLQTRDASQLDQLYNDINALEQPRDRTELTTALRRSRQILERHKMEGNVIVVISDGCPYNLHATVNEALLAWMEGIFIISLGIEEPQISLQKKISSRIQDGNTSIDWSDILMCPSVVLPGIPAGSNCRDFMFVVDGSDSLCHHQDVVKRYLKSAIHRYENVSNSIGITLFGSEIGSQVAPNTNKDVVIAEVNGLDFPLSGTKTATGITEAQKLLDQAGRSNQKALILITDGPPLSLDNAINAVNAARSSGYEIVVIGVGDDISQNDLVSLAGSNSNNMFRVDTYVELYTVDFSTVLCGSRNLVCDNTVAGCVNGNPVTDSAGRCVCSCNGGWSGLRCDDPPCTNAAIGCRNGNAQLDSFGVCRCVCNPGFTGTVCDTPVCTASSIGCINGRAENQFGRCVCTCNVGWTGTRCETRDCSRLIACSNGGTPVDQSGQCRCSCVFGFTDMTCNTRDCSLTTNCLNGGTAVFNSFTNNCECSCTSQFTGNDCRTLVDPCATFTCQNNGQVQRQGTNCLCICPSDYTGDRCQTPFCDGRQPCLNGGTPIRGPRPSSGVCGCDCPQGYTGNQCQIPPRCLINCQYGSRIDNPCSCNCNTGYTGDTCDRCASNTCRNGGFNSPNANCECSCPSGFSGTFCQDRDCGPNLCAEGMPDPDTCNCICNPGFGGPRCDYCDSAATPCSNGNLVPRNGRCVCECLNGFTGPSCNQCPQTCSNGGTNTVVNGRCECQCPIGTSGLQCEITACPNDCMNGGTNDRNMNGFCECRCVSGFTGNRCQDIDCSLRYCQNGAPINVNGNCECNCNPGFTGTTCDTPTPRCLLTCLNGGTLENSGNPTCFCRCPSTFSGTRCEIQDPRDGETCPNSDQLCGVGITARQDCHGRCICQCPPGYGGPRCNIELRADLCDGCDYTRNQVGFIGVKERCDLFVRCMETNGGGVATTIFECPPGTLWDQKLLACNHPELVTCENDYCRDKPFNSTYSHIRECQAFWRCANGKTVRGECCPAGQSFDQQTQTCMENPNCPETCRRDATSLGDCPGSRIGGCELEDDPSDPRVFYQMDRNVRNRFECGPRTVFDKEKCVCVLDTRPVNRQGSCDTADFPVEFNDLGNTSYVFENVPLVPSSVAPGADVKAGNFSGNSRVFLRPFVKSGFHYDRFVARVRINTARLNIGEEYAVISNGDCNVTASMAITVRPSSQNSGTAYFKVVADGNTDETAVDVQYSTDADGWVVLELRYQRSGNSTYDLTGSAKGSGAVITSPSVTAGGVIEARDCPVQIGQGLGHSSFVGLIDWARFWIYCDPTELI